MITIEGLLISDHIGKAASSVLYDAIDDVYHVYVPESQCGAVKKKSGDFATHLLRSVLDYAKARSPSIAIRFVDLVKSFDRLLREIVIGWPQAVELRILSSLVSLRPTQRSLQMRSTIAPSWTT